MKLNFFRLKVYENKSNRQQIIILPKKIFGEVKEAKFLPKKNVIQFK